MLVDALWMEFGLSGLIVFFGYLVFGIAGFGSALIIVPALAWHWPLSSVVPLILLIEVPAIFLHTGLNYRSVIWREIPPLLPFVVLGALVALAISAWGVGQWLLLCLGVYVCTVGLRGLLGKPIHRMASHRGKVIAGFAMGLIETLFGTSGPVVMTWLIKRIRDPQELRATMPVVLMLLTCIALTGTALTGGLAHSGLWRRLLVLLPFALLGIWIGNRLARRVQGAHWNTIVFALLSVSGSVLAGNAIWRLVH